MKKNRDIRKGIKGVDKGKEDYNAIRRFWSIKPVTKPHSSEKGKRGYDRKNKSWKNE
jgi:hypothetical protein